MNPNVPLSLALGAILLGARPVPAAAPDWTRFVRIAAWDLNKGDPAAIVAEARRGRVFGIEVDNDITGRYESFLDPTSKLEAIRAVARTAHKDGNRAFVYIAGTECITARADEKTHTMAKDHPDWLQRKRSGEPAVFGGGTAFWIAPGDEDVWISPFAIEWRRIYMERVKQIAATGIDGIYVDIPYWMTHFDGWEESWASFDDYTVAEFKKRTGLDAKNDVRPGDFDDPGFRKWVDFRIAALTEFVDEIARVAKSVDPAIKVIPEIYPGIEREAVQVGADVYSMYGVADAIAHEYEFGGGDHMASSRTPLEWFFYMAGWSSFRAFAGEKATWMLNYSWDGDARVSPKDAMENLFMAEVMAGVNPWDARGHVMSGSNDLETRRRVFGWIAEHEGTFFGSRRPIRPIGVYFSPATRNRAPEEFLKSYRGILLMTLQEHLEHEVVTPRTLAAFRGETLVLPDVRFLDDDERAALSAFRARGGRLVVTGTDATALGGAANVTRWPACPGKAYAESLERDFVSAAPREQQPFLDSVSGRPSIRVEAPKEVAVQIAEVGGRPHVFFANFAGLGPGRAVPIPAADVRVVVEERRFKRLMVLPFLGQAVTLAATRRGSAAVFTIPRIERGAVAWLE